MSLLVVYIAALLVGQSISVGIGVLMDRVYSSHVGLMAFIACYFVMFWLVWRFAVLITTPRTPPQQSRRLGERAAGS